MMAVNIGKFFFTLCLNVFTLFDNITLSGKQFQRSGPKYYKDFLSAWKSFKEKFLVTVLFKLDVL